jgi:hypothetical protein
MNPAPPAPRRGARLIATRLPGALLGLLASGALLTGCGDEDDDGEVPAPGDVVWSSEVRTLVIASSGGGLFPSPPGSECTSSSGEYTLRIPELRLDARACEGEDGQPLRNVQRSRPITDAELRWLAPALERLVVVDDDACGADKPELSLRLVTADGVREYRDSFYGCVPDPRPTVDTSALEEVFGLLGELSRT